MNQFEESALLKISSGTMPISGEEDFMTHPGVSRLVAERIIRDVHSIYPDLDFSNLHCLAEIANQFATDDGLVATSNLDLPLTAAFERLNFQIALTTIWVAIFTRIHSSSKCRTLVKKQREFQVCLLIYFFNQIIGTPPAQLRKRVEEVSLRKYGLMGWYFDNTKERENEKLQILFDVMHLCSLEYWNPKARDGSPS